MVFTLHRYILRDLVKYFLLATLVLSVVLGLGVMLRPLREFSVDPANVPMLIVCTLPITLTMVIPIAALLAATLVYGRLAADNEINACRSSGISMLTLAYPATAFALMVGMTTLILAFHVIPSFTQRFEKIIRADARTIIFRNIEKKGNLGELFPDVRIHADRADTQARTLYGVAVAWMEKGKVLRTITAEKVLVTFADASSADGDLSSGEPSGQNQVLLDLTNAQMLDKEQSVFLGQQPLTIDLPTLWQDEVKFKKLAELKAIQADMTRFHPIAKEYQALRQQILVERFFAWCDHEFRQNGQVTLQGASERVRLEAAGCQPLKTSRSGAESESARWKAQLTPLPDDGVRARRAASTMSPDRPDRLYDAQGALLAVTSYGRAPQAIVTLRNLHWRYEGAEASYALLQQDIVRLELPRSLIRDVQDITWSNVREAQNLTQLARVAEPSRSLEKLFKVVREDAHDLAVEIELELHSRLAFGVSCVVLVLLGTALGIVFRSSHLLAAFGVSFVPAAICLVTIFTGKHIAEKSSTSTLVGIAFLWSGIVLVAVANAWLYRRLMKR